MIRPPQIPVLADPKMIDVVFAEIQNKLVSLTWLQHAFGKARKQKIVRDGKTIVRPTVYAGGLEYRPVFPDGHLGNFSFFNIEDGEEIGGTRSNYEFEVSFGLIFWFDFRKVYPTDWEQRTIDNVKHDVLQIFKGSFKTATIELSQFFEESQNIYRGYTDTEIDTQFLMRPYGGLKITGTITNFFEKSRC